MKPYFILLLVILLTSCAQKQKFTRAEWLSATQKTYKNYSKEQLIEAAEKVLSLADKSDFQFSHMDKGFVATRNWSVYMVIAAAQGIDTWKFEVEEINGVSSARVNTSTMAGAMSGYSTGGQSGVVTSPGMMGNTVEGTAHYNMFWNRMDYFLGLTKTWADCTCGQKQIESKETWGDLDHICSSVTLNDLSPETLSETENTRIATNKRAYTISQAGTYSGKKEMIQCPSTPAATVLVNSASESKIPVP